MGFGDIKFDRKTVFLVTGGAGFIGSNICEELVNQGYNVRCLDNLSTGSMKNIASLLNKPNFSFINGDITNFDICKKSCVDVDYVLHQAAWGSVPRSIEMPLVYEEINIKGTLNMLEASRIFKIKKFIYASSSSVYGDDHNLPKKEGIEGELLSPYAITKKSNEDYAKIYTKLYKLETIGLRYFNVFGRRQNPKGNYAAVIPKFLDFIINNKQPIINGDGYQSRDFTYIDNVIEANLRACLANHEASGKVFNIAFGGRITLLDVIQQMSQILGKLVTPIFLDSRVGDILHSNADISRAKELLGYNPDINFEYGLEKYIEWYKNDIETGNLV